MGAETLVVALVGYFDHGVILPLSATTRVSAHVSIPPTPTMTYSG